MEYIINSKKYGQKIVLLDEEDYKAVMNENYSLSLTYDKTIKNFYVAFTKKPSKGGSRLLHRYIMQPSKGMTVDHIKVNEKMINLGWFKEFDKAVECRLEAERKYFPTEGVM